MDADAVQARIHEAISPLLKRIEVLQSENKEIREILNKIQTPKTNNHGRINENYSVTQKPTTAVPRKMLEKKEVRTEKLQKVATKEEEMIQKIENPYSHQNQGAKKQTQRLKKEPLNTPNLNKRPSITQLQKPNVLKNLKKPETVPNVKSPQTEKKTPATNSRINKAEHKKEAVKEAKAEKKEYMKKVEQLIGQAAKIEEQQTASVEKTESAIQKMEKPEEVSQTDIAKRQKNIVQPKKQSKVVTNSSHVKKEKKAPLHSNDRNEKIEQNESVVNTENENPNLKQEVKTEKSIEFKTEKNKKQGDKKAQVQKPKRAEAKKGSHHIQDQKKQQRIDKAH